jgi:hypothetical protein
LCDIRWYHRNYPGIRRGFLLSNRFLVAGLFGITAKQLADRFRVAALFGITARQLADRFLVAALLGMTAWLAKRVKGAKELPVGSSFAPYYLYRFGRHPDPPKAERDPPAMRGIRSFPNPTPGGKTLPGSALRKG